eukprot:3720795-Amphidinium_carterae.2
MDNECNEMCRGRYRCERRDLCRRMTVALLTLVMQCGCLYAESVSALGVGTTATGYPCAAPHRCCDTCANKQENRMRGSNICEMKHAAC